MSASPEQAAIINHPVDRHANVVAVAGSGKSYTLVERIAFLVEAKRTNPSDICAVMFGSEASKEFQRRLITRLGRRNSPASLTFHGLGTETLARLAKRGFAERWTFSANAYDAQKLATNVVWDSCKQHGYKYPRLVADVFLQFVDRVKGDLLPPEEVWAAGDWEAHYSWFVPMFAVYEKVRTAKKLRFFSDLIYDPVMILKTNDEAANFIAGKYQHVILDEYQDIGESQQALIRFIAGTRARVMCVGDDDQTIFTWRGAKPSYIIKDFDRDFPGGLHYRLTRTRRYGAMLSCAANYVISHNLDRTAKFCISHEQTPDTCVDVEWERSDGSSLLKLAGVARERGYQLNDVAVLVRTYARSAASQFALLRAGVPFRLEGGDDKSVLNNRWVAGLLGWMRVAAGQLVARPYAGEPDMGSVMELRRTLDVPPIGLSFEGCKALCKAVLQAPDGMEGFMHFVRTGLQQQEGILSERILNRGKLYRRVRGSAQHGRALSPLDLATELVDSLGLIGAIKKFAKNDSDAEDQQELLDAFLRYVGANESRGVDGFLQHIADLQSFSDRAKEATDALLITTLHRSKGLEWPVVIMIGLYQGGFPHQPKRPPPPEREEARIEDERRLFYVGMTRARHQLWMLCPEDLGLIQWWRAGLSGKPRSLRNSADLASQFLYECNLYLAKALPTMISRNVSGLKAANPEVFNEYLEHLGLSQRCARVSLELPQ
ncbi:MULTISPECIES: ATP-dependent helicase [unclassified Pseudomonas]|uniref:ATP-dependent helicase n=1 Tax=unclassified Pseudomonas TaxID=196821 RepID=UPI00226AF6BD